ncbi:MAG: metal-binding protein [Deltaproteobacteria bacterium]|nr:MAG: metal-binding protein [Deltaproteobacteria bacterium]
MTHKLSDCARCPFAIAERLCRNPNGKAPDFCPTRDLSELTEKSLKVYEKSEYAEFARQASIQEAEGYANRELGYARVRPAKTRIEEIAEFAQKMHYQRLGLAFCVGLRREAKIVAEIYSERGFEVVSVICKTGCSDKNLIGLNDNQKIVQNEPETMCNPILQALVLNQAKTDFNILLGLCVGHDSLFLKEAEAPGTVLAVKDRVLGHNPLAAVYNIDSYYRSLK